MIHLYAFASGLRSLPDLPGIDGAALERRRAGGLTAVVSRLAAAVDAYESVLRHGAVVEALVETCEAVLPARFAERFATDAELDAATAPRAAALRRRLEEVRGHVELGVRIGTSAHAREPVGTATGAAYMRGRLEEGAEVTDLERDLRRLSRDVVASHAHGFCAAFLVARADVAAFAARVDSFAARNRSLDVLCTGPWPPYSFADPE